MIERTSVFDGGDNTWVRDYLKPRYPELVKDYLEASRLFRSSKKRGAVSARALATLTAHAGSSRTPLGENVATMLGELYEIDKSVEVSIRELAAGRAVHSRVNALVALASCRAGKLHEELLAGLLTDRSARVRALAADKIVAHGMSQLSGNLTTAFQNETKPELKAELRADVDYLTQGYHLRKEGSNVWVTCRVGGSSVSTWFSTKAFESEGRAWIKARLERMREP